MHNVILLSNTTSYRWLCILQPVQDVKIWYNFMANVYHEYRSENSYFSSHPHQQTNAKCHFRIQLLLVYYADESSRTNHTMMVCHKISQYCTGMGIKAIIRYPELEHIKRWRVYSTVLNFSRTGKPHYTTLRHCSIAWFMLPVQCILYAVQYMSWCRVVVVL